MADEQGHILVVDDYKTNRLKLSLGLKNQGHTVALAEMIDSYLETAPPLLAELNQSLSSGDAVTFRRAAHTLKSGSADFGALTLSKLCEQLEEIGKAGELAGAETLLAQAEAIYKQVKIALTELRNQQA